MKAGKAFIGAQLTKSPPMLRAQNRGTQRARALLGAQIAAAIWRAPDHILAIELVPSPKLYTG